MTIANTLKEKVGRLFFVGLPGDKLDDDALRLINEIKPGGICLFARNCKNAQDIRSLLDGLRDVLPFTPFLSLDQEGGLVDRLRRVAEPMPSAADVSGSGSADLTQRFGSITARLIRMLGFNMNFAPVLDVIDSSRFGNNNGSLQSRAFGTSAEDVVRLAGTYANALFEEGIMPCHKHFPGIGGIEVDAHDDLPAVTGSREDLRQKDLVPYLQLLNKPSTHAVMTGHTVFPEFDLQERGADGKLLPTSLSHNIVTGLLRGELGFEGLALTDDLEMGAIVRNYGMAEASRLAVNAGNDFLLICNDPVLIREGFYGVLEGIESGIIKEERIDESIGRIDSARKLLNEPTDFDKDNLAELSREIRILKQDINT